MFTFLWNILNKCQWFGMDTALLKDQRAFSLLRLDCVLWTCFLMHAKLKPDNTVSFLVPCFLLEDILVCRVVICMIIYSPCHKRQLPGLNLHCEVYLVAGYRQAMSLKKPCLKDVKLVLPTLKNLGRCCSRRITLLGNGKQDRSTSLAWNSCQFSDLFLIRSLQDGHMFCY